MIYVNVSISVPNTCRFGFDVTVLKTDRLQYGILEFYFFDRQFQTWTDKLTMPFFVV